MSSDRPGVGQLQALVASASYVPSTRAIRARNQFWATPGIELTGDTELAATLALAPNREVYKVIEKNWSNSDFRTWWSSPNWEREESQRLLHLAMGRLSEILVEEEDPSLVLSAAKEAREVYTRLNGQEKQKFADADINEMDQRQLEEFLRRNSSLIDSISNKSK
jgi:hypothetical protein